MKKWKERKKEIGTKNHKKVDGKLLRTDKQFRHLKQRQKETISTWLYEEYRRLWIEKGQEPHKHNNWKIVAAVMERIEAAGIWLPEQEVTKYFYRRKTHYRNRIEKAKAGGQISLAEYAEALKAEKKQAEPEKKSSIRAQLKAAKEQAPKKQARQKTQDLERS